MPLPPGYTLDTPQMKLPAGYTLDAPAPPSNRPAGLPAGVDLPQLDAHPAVNMQPSILGRDPNPGPVANFAKGLVKSIPGTMAGIAKLAPGASDAWQPLEQAATTNGTAQAIGKGVGNVAQFLIPGAAEEKLGTYGASKLLPIAGEYASPLAKTAVSALSTGAVNKAQGGSFGAGALAGGVGAGIGMGLAKVAPVLAEAGLGIRGVDRSYGRTPGRAILDETTGVSPGDIANQASNKVGLYTSQLNDAARSSTLPVNLQPARDTAASWLNTAVERNNPSTTKEVGQIGSQLEARPTTGVIPQIVPAHEGLALRRGIDDLQTSWNPATVKDFSNRAVGATRNALGNELEAAIPQYRDLNSKISTLLPISQRATAKDLNAGFIQRSLGRLGAHTGALVGAGAGGAYGYKEGGLPGAALGATMGIAVPELVASPEFQLGVARLANSPTTLRTIPAVAGGGLQLLPKKQ